MAYTSGNFSAVKHTIEQAIGWAIDKTPENYVKRFYSDILNNNGSD